jgi:hypothetical protein
MVDWEVGKGIPERAAFSTEKDRCSEVAERRRSLIRSYIGPVCLAWPFPSMPRSAVSNCGYGNSAGQGSCLHHSKSDVYDGYSR